MKDQLRKPLSFKGIFSNLAIYGSSHAAVDATCAATMLSLSRVYFINSGLLFAFVLLYDTIAFGFQVPFGLIIDKWRRPVFSAIVGCVLTAVSAAIVVFLPVVAVIVAGVGNALFHVGGGTISLNLTPGRAIAPGIFVAPGTVGLFIGTIIGRDGYFVSWPFVVMLAILCIGICGTETPRLDYRERSNKEMPRLNFQSFELILLLVLSAIAVRSFVGLAVDLPWKSVVTLSVTLTVALMLGKAFGGVLGDKLGWVRFSVVSLLISAPLLSFGAGIPSCAIAAMFLFNMTMPITLTAVSNMLPGRPGFSFGLTCLALIAGALPTFTDSSLFADQLLLFVVIFASAALLFFGLLLYSKTYNPEDIGR